MASVRGQGFERGKRVSHGVIWAKSTWAKAVADAKALRPRLPAELRERWSQSALCEWGRAVGEDRGCAHVVVTLVFLSLEWNREHFGGDGNEPWLRILCGLLLTSATSTLPGCLSGAGACPTCSHPLALAHALPSPWSISCRFCPCSSHTWFLIYLHPPV